MGYHEGHLALEFCIIFIIIPLSVYHRIVFGWLTMEYGSVTGRRA
jgi:hypothetical protein